VPLLHSAKVTSAVLVRPPETQAAPNARADSPAVFQIPSLDGLRAVSFMIVFVAHAGLGGFVPGYFGLSLFFFLSGYLITTLLRLEFDKCGDISLRQFYLRRVLRIFPPFYLILLVTAILTALGAWEGSLTVKALAYQLLHLTNYYIIGNGWWLGMPPGTWVYWSLAIEEHFYLLFPLLYLLLRRRTASGQTQAGVLLGLCLLVLVWRCILIFGFEVGKDRTYVATDTRVDAILAGCILAVWNNPAVDPTSSDERLLKFVWLPLGIAAVLASLLIREPRFEQTLRYTLQSFGLLPIFIAAIRWHDAGPFRLLNLRFVRYLGMLSYSMYLMHTSALWAAINWTRWPIFVQGPVVLVALVLIASVIHRYIEKPAAALRRRLSPYVSSDKPAS
jgi:peptidoglycan/LPS O-acetylase OafA/YrhL